MPVGDGEELVAYGRKPSDWDEDAFQGIHARYVLAILDEAGGVPRSLYTAVETITTSEECRVLAIGNPDHRWDAVCPRLPLAGLGRLSRSMA